jgi:hypothetical protein
VLSDEVQQAYHSISNDQHAAAGCDSLRRTHGCRLLVARMPPTLYPLQVLGETSRASGISTRRSKCSATGLLHRSSGVRTLAHVPLLVHYFLPRLVGRHAKRLKLSPAKTTAVFQIAEAVLSSCKGKLRCLAAVRLHHDTRASRPTCMRRQHDQEHSIVLQKARDFTMLRTCSAAPFWGCVGPAPVRATRTFHQTRLHMLQPSS